MIKLPGFRSPIQQAYKNSRKAFLNNPDLTPFQREHGGKLITGNSGIVPFIRTSSGSVFAPFGGRQNNFKK